ncbi:MAG: class II fructose-bisphosphate aldolase [Candidatus Bathyarchaeia archaeon]|nr:class II fructose-bisphosphate aldolase [Candidatus Bathyarchaeota archaeon]
MESQSSGEPGIAEIMRRAFEKRILIPAFNAAYLPMIKPIIEALVDHETFGLVEVARLEVEKFGAVSFAAAAQEYRRYMENRMNRRCTRLHQDHVPVIDEDGFKVDWRRLIREGLENGYDSVMIDGSRLPFEENVEATREVVEMAHGKGRPVEAELGAVLGHEKEAQPYEEIYRDKIGFTDPGEAKVFVEETGVDWLSVAIGNIHGAITKIATDKEKVRAILDVEHLSKIRQATNIPLVLHGGSGIQIEYLRKAIENGITKINIGFDIRQAYEQALKAKPNDIEYARRKVYEKIGQLITEVYGIEGTIHRI